MGNIKNIIYKIIKDVINEERYDKTATPYNSKDERHYLIGKNPLTVNNGGHASNDILSQPSTFDKNGATFTSDTNIILSDNKFIIYKIKNFGTDKIDATINLFGQGAKGEKLLRREIDVMNGAAQRNGRNLIYRTITSNSNEQRSKKTNRMSNTFWEFSFNNGDTWYIVKPNGTQSMQESKLIKKI